ncbi:MAG: prolipoprotein diacylglyceryl transferase [Pseudomonadota bacterium]
MENPTLMIAAMAYPNIDPIALQLGPLAIRWYSLAYIVGLLLAWRYCRWLALKPPARLKPEAFDDLLLWATLGVVLGGRLGYVLFYKPLHFLDHPGEIVRLWEGGMSFHGGMLGVFLAMLFFARSRGVSFFTLSDIVGCAAPIGLFLGRIANFINGELYGRVAEDQNLPWVMVFPGGGAFARHPSQLYEAVLEGLLLFLILFLAAQRGALQRTGLLSGIFMLGYGLSRVAVEAFREPDDHLGFIVSTITMGQILTVPMVLIGIFLILWSRRTA